MFSAMLRYVIRNAEFSKEERKASQEAKKILLEKLKQNGKDIKDLTFNKYEEMIMSNVIFSHQIDTDFQDIGGLEQIKESIYETVILPLQSPHLFVLDRKSPQKLIGPPIGVLLYGPPGTGKTSMAKAIARSCKATFIDLRLSTIQTKWYGDSQKLIRAVFSLANKFAPSIIFIDEIDQIFRKQFSMTHEVSASIKAEFLTLWDGLNTEKTGNILILAATNRPFDLDPAVLRRLPRTFLFDLPNQNERKKILDVLLKGQSLSNNVSTLVLASKTESYTGSDLKEMCRYAAMLPIRELIKQQRQNSQSFIPQKISGTPRAITFQDFEEALRCVHPTGKTSYEYQKLFQEQENQRLLPTLPHSSTSNQK